MWGVECGIFGAQAGIFLVFLPARMSCKLWLNVWTCRSFTCPFTLRNLDRNPTAALISGFIVPRAQRVCIEKGDGDDPRAFVVFLYVFVRPFVSTSEWSVFVGACVFLSWHLFVEVEERFLGESARTGSVLGFGRPLLVNTGACVFRGGVSCCHTVRTVPVYHPPPEWGSRRGGAGFYGAPALPSASTQAATATTAHQSRACLLLTSHI